MLGVELSNLPYLYAKVNDLLNSVYTFGGGEAKRISSYGVPSLWFGFACYFPELRAESSLLKEHVEAQVKELNQWKQRVEELEEKERVANENVEGLMLDIAAAEEEITRWKGAAEQEAAAGKAVEQEFVAQLGAVRQDLEEAKQAIIESERKLKFKEETAAAAMTARDAAEKSLRLADLRASRLRDRVEELTHQLEELDIRDTSRTGLSRPRYLGAVRQDLEEAKQAIIESERKLKFKEETAAAAMTARDAAEKSLRLADLRASRLRDRVEELTHQLEELDIRDTSRTGLSRPRYLGAVRQDLEEAKQAIIESERKLKFKEETAAAAMTARDAAEKSLRLADLRASRLRDRVEELTHQLEELDIRDTSRTGLSRPRYVCWPWQWLGLDFVGSQRSDMQLESANEMELSEPLL
ncbi:unnamed protein product [Ilex paraguariensis]|uniref:Uncharacterized protein n=1 Tax=Ilex paraguariensis TaxID=185542 RepID=A0ABC8U2K6_9AQUA